MKKDPRINAKSITFGNYIIIFLIMLFFCGSYAGLYFMQIQNGELIYIILSMFAYIIVISLAVCVLFAFFRRKVLMRPVYRLCEAAQKVANGDFSVRLSSMRKDEKKDEFEVLFEDFNTMVSELESTEILKNDFVSNVSHELKTPLAVIQNYASILQSDELTDEERKEYSNRIGAAADRLSVLVTNILQVNRLENQKITPILHPFNLSEALSRCILNYDTLLDEKQIELEIQLDQNLIVNGDEHLLDMVWNNLISNAIKFTTPKGKIEIEAKKEDGFVSVSVSDSGCGINADSLHHIFDKFYQADTSHATEGNGLGLALVKRILDLLGGDISVVSVAEKGSVFTVKLY
ncbi:MAG: HAMP domain-containing sensor histidine kinase [Oscillospiraceae bacterium]|nr:HAMP domain-containing sensor histidine kinase [Oscillospiraceae bacterium]